MTLLERVPTGDMVVLDRGYPAAWLFKLCTKKRIRVVARISGSWKPTLVKTLGVGDCIVEIRGEVPKAYRESLEGSKRVSLRMRMVEYQIGDHERVCLLTDLMDPKRYPAVELAKAYHLRWECEISYDEVKNHLAAVATGGLDLTFRSKTPDGVLQELYALLALYNMVRGLMAEAGRRHGVMASTHWTSASSPPFASSRKRRPDTKRQTRISVHESSTNSTRTLPISKTTGRAAHDSVRVPSGSR